jgi:hypothetical protein
MVLVLGATGLPDANATIYRLGPGSTYEVGCFDPCLCPITMMSVRGTFELNLVGFDGLFWNYTVDNVQWMATYGAGGSPITGSGTYRVGGEFASMHQMELDLVVGNNPVEHFNSTLVVGGANFPTIDIVISINQMFCFDQVVAIHSNPLGDLDEDGDADNDDMDIFVAVLLGTDTTPTHVTLADVNLDGANSGADIGPFTAILLGM